jgi:hypothetical protein
MNRQTLFAVRLGGNQHRSGEKEDHDCLHDVSYVQRNKDELQRSEAIVNPNGNILRLAPQVIFRERGTERSIYLPRMLFFDINGALDPPNHPRHRRNPRFD